MSPAERRDYLRDIVANDLGVNPDFVLSKPPVSASLAVPPVQSGHDAAPAAAHSLSELPPAPPTTPDLAATPELAAGRASLPITTS